MQENRTKVEDEETRAPSDHVSVAEVAMDALAAAIAGAATGVLAGPPGIVAGAVIGGAIGAAARVAVHDTRIEHNAKEEKLDRDIGVIGGNIGEARADAPPARRGTFSASSLGLGAQAELEPSEGPIQSLDED
jgi:uncharacterized membrane protein